MLLRPRPHSVLFFSLDQSLSYPPLLWIAVLYFLTIFLPALSLQGAPVNHPLRPLLLSNRPPSPLSRVSRADADSSSVPTSFSDEENVIEDSSLIYLDPAESLQPPPPLHHPPPLVLPFPDATLNPSYHDSLIYVHSHSGSVSPNAPISSTLRHAATAHSSWHEASGSSRHMATAAAATTVDAWGRPASNPLPIRYSSTAIGAALQGIDDEERGGRGEGRSIPATAHPAASLFRMRADDEAQVEARKLMAVRSRGREAQPEDEEEYDSTAQVEQVLSPRISPSKPITIPTRSAASAQMNRERWF